MERFIAFYLPYIHTFYRSLHLGKIKRLSDSIFFLIWSRSLLFGLLLWAISSFEGLYIFIASNQIISIPFHFSQELSSLARIDFGETVPSTKIVQKRFFIRLEGRIRWTFLDGIQFAKSLSENWWMFLSNIQWNSGSMEGYCFKILLLRRASFSFKHAVHRIMEEI